MEIIRKCNVGLAAILALAASAPALFGQDFKRGDVNGDGCFGLADANSLVEFLFMGASLNCLAAADANDDDIINLMDVVTIVAAFQETISSLPAPGFEMCGPDPTPGVACDFYTACAPCDPSLCDDLGSGGAIEFPPRCGYVTPAEVHMIVDGLPPGTTIIVRVIHGDFSNVTTTPGGALGGEIEQFDSTLTLQMEGTGALTGFNRAITLAAPVEIHTAPTQPGQPIQVIETEMVGLEAQLTGDVDFDQIQIVAGSNAGLASTGVTTLTDNTPPPALPFYTSYDVDSVFNVNYRIDFIGALGGQLQGLSGTTIDTAAIETPGTLAIQFKVGNVNADAGIDIGDVITILTALFPPPAVPLFDSCPAAFDCNHDDAVDIADPIYLLSWMFIDGPALPAWGGPVPACSTAGPVLGCLVGQSCP